ncbi:MAG: DUF1810 domain-containing protein [Rhodobacteraceae bacterium]|nr:DUF1810 domain-containing protein [Paracoccaceae bacterium]
MDPEELQDFVDAQDPVLDTVRAELAAGRKASHWMWFIFPQLADLGRSPMAQFYGLANLDEAAAYLAHPVLGPRLVEMSGLLLTHRSTAPEEIMGRIDAMKLRSSMTLFSRVPGAGPVFGEVLEAFYGGEPCPKTLEMLGSPG